MLFSVTALAALAATATAASSKNGTLTNPNTNGTNTVQYPTGTGMPSSTGTGSSEPNPVPQGKNTFTVHPDGQCAKKLTAKVQSFEVNPANGFPKQTVIQQPTFEGAESAQGGGWNVYWGLPKPQPGCRWLVMLPYRQASGQPGYAGGNEIINAGREGCYFGNIPTDSDVMLSFCCGSGDCEKASLNSTSLLSAPQRRELQIRDSIKAETAAQEAKNEALRRDIAAAAVEAFGGSPAAQANAHAKRYWYEAPPAPPKPKDCKIVKQGQPYSRAGRQVVVSSSQPCTTTPCNVALNYQISYSTTATSQKTTTLTNSVGASVAVKAGIDFIAEAEVTTTLSTDFSRAVAEATGTNVMQGNSSSVTNTISLPLGNRGVVTFTPVYKCITGPLDCGGGESSPIDFCQPDLSGLGGSPAGDYYPLVSD